MTIENSLEKIASTLELILEELRRVNGAPVVKDESDDFSDPIMGEVLDYIVNSETIRTTTLQRKFQIGYGRAAKLLDLLEEAKIVCPVDGAKPREVLISKRQYQKIKKSKGITLKF